MSSGLARVTATVTDPTDAEDYRREVIYTDGDWVRRSRWAMPTVLEECLLVVDPDDGDRPRWLAYGCPCGSGEVVYIHIDPRAVSGPGDPVWRLIARDPLTVLPSVDGHCTRPSSDDLNWTRRERCHYWLRNGRVVWV